MKNLSSRVTLLTLLSTLFTFQVALAQDLDTVNISGQIQDQNGAAIPGVLVEITLQTTGAKRNSTTDEAGRYRLIQLEPGRYVVRVNAAGFASQELTNVLTVAGQNLQLNIVLPPATVDAQTVVVVANDSASIDPRRVVVGGRFTSREAQSLPAASRSVLDLIFMLPGVTEE